MKVISYLRIGDTRVKFDDLTSKQQEDCFYKMEMQVMKAIGQYIPSPKWFEEHPEHREYWERIIPV